jgi:hypothetical protein
LPLIAGPLISALGFALMAVAGPDGPYWSAFLLPMAILGLGMAVAVAPLTTTVMNSVPVERAGVASGINNAAAAVANLLALAILGAVALTAFDRALDRALAAQPRSIDVQHALADARGKFAIEPVLARVPEAERPAAESLLRTSLADSIALGFWLAAILALAGAACAALTIPGAPRAAGVPFGPSASPPKAQLPLGNANT